MKSSGGRLTNQAPIHPDISAMVTGFKSELSSQFASQGKDLISDAHLVSSVGCLPQIG